MDGGIIAIGNAPSALYEVINMVREGITKPALVVGIPVGFVSAAESKDELAKMNDLPFITNAGRKGEKLCSILNNKCDNAALPEQDVICVKI